MNQTDPHHQANHPQFDPNYYQADNDLEARFLQDVYYEDSPHRPNPIPNVIAFNYLLPNLLIYSPTQLPAAFQQISIPALHIH